MLKIENISHIYQVGKHPIAALSKINLCIEKGEFVCIVGPSGCGKSTLLRITAGLLKPSQGRILLNDQPINEPQHEMGIVFQQANLLPWRTVSDNVGLPLDLTSMPLSDRAQRIDRMLNQLGLQQFAHAYPSVLSGGMAQRVAIGRALIHDPAILLLDEPFGSLDALTREQMQLELLRLWSANRKTVLMVTHSITEAIFVADRVVVMGPRPGAIRALISVDLPRPRTLDMLYWLPFGRLATQVRQQIHTP